MMIMVIQEALSYFLEQFLVKTATVIAAKKLNKNMSVYRCFVKWRLIHAPICQETEDIIQKCQLLCWKKNGEGCETTGSNQDKKRSKRLRYITVLEDKYIWSVFEKPMPYRCWADIQ